MATFLTTSRMAPELAARIEASVRGRRNQDDATGARRTSKPLVVALVRFGVLAFVVAVVCYVVVLRRRDRRDFERSRAALLDSVHAVSAQLTPEDQATVPLVESWLERSSGAYEGDTVASELRAPGALAAILARPTIYLRGPIAELNNPAGIAQAATASLKDPLVVCLLDPPESRTEKVVLAKVRDAFSASAEQHSPGVRRFRDAQVGMPFLLPAWAELVQGAKTPEELDLLRDQLEKAPVDRAARAAKAKLLLFAMDEQGEPGGATELDGERIHQVRVELVDLTSAKVLLRTRKRVDPSWISTAKRPMYASGLDSCALALDVRETVAR